MKNRACMTANQAGFNKYLTPSFIVDNHSRVVLSGDESQDYINASFIDVSTESV